MSGLPAVGNPATVVLEPEEFAPGAVIDGAPRMMSRDLYVSSDERVFSGIWSVTPGTFHDVMDGDETFVVLAGLTVETVADRAAGGPGGDVAGV